ncbi:MAG: hypothetical protein BZY88_09885 [SAR202 cluster bacterium Io17-Chloro-G9]|nr:MAG: hypothetical protein BZY88_09885 [SAR202 cluster bacterium Io17-Chloro-G9]
MHDLPQEAWRNRRDLQDRLCDLIASFGYSHLETPILEPTDLFLRKSGGALASRIYSFTDPGSNLVSLRPEFTSSIMRHYLEHVEETFLPARWQYAGPVFRYDVSHPESRGQFTQIGAELLGSSSILADAEVLGLATQVLSALELPGEVDEWRLELADLDVLNSVLDAVGVSERTRTFIIDSVPKLKLGRQVIPQVMEEADRLRLTGQNAQEDHLVEAVQGLDDGQARVVLRGLLKWSAADQLGQRTADEVVERLLRKLRGSDDSKTLKRGLELACDLAVVRGDPETALSKVGVVVRVAGAESGAFQRLSQLMNLVLSDSAIGGHLDLDFGLVRGMAYYNGIVFEVNHPRWPESLGGGGRYDGLARALGARDTVPALGFAYNLEALLAISSATSKGGFTGSTKETALVVTDSPKAIRDALLATQEMRQQGISAELDVDDLDLDRALAYASQKGINKVVQLGSDGQRKVHIIE